MNLPLDNIYRRFLLGIASDEEEERAEGAILSGSVDAAEIDILEDSLIDDYLFGDLAPDEEQAFRINFLSVDERRQKLDIARTLMQYARNQPSAAPESLKGLPHRRGQRFTLSWPRFAVAALVAAIVLACLVGFQQILLRQKTQLSKNSQNEIARLQQALASSGSSPRLDPVEETYFVLPRTTRDALHPLVLQISPRARLVWINLKLISPSAGTYTVELIKDGKTLWSQEMDASRAPAVDKNVIVLPAYLLGSGMYLIQLKDPNTAPLVQQVFRVQRN